MGASQSSELQMAVVVNIISARLVEPTDRVFWDKVLNLSVSPSDVFDNLTFDVLRVVRDRQPQNFATLLKLASMELHSVVWRHKQTKAMVTAASLHSPQSAAADPITAATVAFVQERKALILNCVRILSRLLAVVAENPSHPIRAFITGGVLYGMVEKREEERRRKEELAARKAKEKRDQEELIRRAREIQAEKEREEAVRREEQRQLDRIRIEKEAKEAVEAADAAQAKAKEAHSSAESSPQSGSDVSSSQRSTAPFGTGSAAPALSKDEEFAEEESTRPPTNEAAVARLQSVEGDVEEVEVRRGEEEEKREAEADEKGQGQPAGESHQKTESAPTAEKESSHSTSADEATAASNFAFISAAASAAAAPSTDAGTEKEQETIDAAKPIADAPAVQSAPTEPPVTAAPVSAAPPSSSTGSTPPAPSTPSLSKRASPKVRSEPPLDEWWTGQLYGSPLSSVIVSILIELAFLPSFTLPSTPTPFVVRQDLHLGRCWAPGAGFPPKLSSSSYAAASQYVGEEWELDSHRVEVLRCLLAAMSSSMFSPTVVADDPFLSALVGAPHELTTTFGFSLLNVLLGYRAEAILPYAYALSTDYRAPLVELSSHLLLILLDFPGPTAEIEGEGEEKRKELADESQGKGKVNGHDGVLTEAQGEKPPSRATSSSAPSSSPPPRPLAVSIPADGSISASAVTTQRHAEPSLQRQAEQRRAVSQPSPHTNVFIDRLFSLSPPDLTYTYQSICRLLHYGMQANATFLPGSSSGITIEAELFVLLWKWLDRDPNFLPHILEKCDILHLVTPLLYYVYSARMDPSKVGLMYTCVFILLKLSGEREFSVELNRTIGSVPSLAHIPLLSILGFPDFHEGTYGDALIVVAHQLIVSSPNHLDALLKVLLTLLTNVSPYLTKVSAVASIRLLALFELFTAPDFLYANATNHQYTLLLLDLFNNAVQYQYAGAGQLILAIVRRARAFYALRITAPGESYMQPMQGVGSKGHAVVFQRTNPPSPQHSMTAPLPSSSPSSALGASALGASAPAISQPVPVTAPAGDGDQPNPPLSASQPLPSTDATPAKTSPDRSASAAAPSPKSGPPPAAGGGSGGGAGGEGGFQGGEAWAAEWKARLPLECLFRLFDFLLPKIEAMARATPNLTDAAVLHFIQSQTLVGILPLPHPIVVRRYIRNPFTNAWFSTYLWGLVFVKAQMHPHKLFDAAKVKLFVISGKGGRGTQGGGGGGAQAAEAEEAEAEAAKANTAIAAQPGKA